MNPSTFVGADRSAGWRTTMGACRARSAAPDGGLCSWNTSSRSANGERGDGIDHELEPQSLLRQPVLDARGSGVDHPPFEDASVLELDQPLCQRSRRDGPDCLLELVEPGRAFVGGPEHGDDPAPFEEVRRPADLLGNGAAGPTPHAAG